MKKSILFLTTAILIHLSSNAAITFRNMDDNSPVANGTMMHHYGDIDETLLHWARLRVINNTGTTTKINMKRYTLSVAASVEDYFCWYVCLASVESMSNPELNHSTGSCFNSNNNDTLNYFGAYCKPMGMLGNYVYRYVWFDSNNPSDSAYIDLTFHVTPVSVNENIKNISFTSFPNPATDFINVSLVDADFSSQISVEIFDIIGNKVMQQVITSSQTRLNVSELSEGAYLITVLNDKKAVLTKRIIINR